MSDTEVKVLLTRLKSIESYVTKSGADRAWQVALRSLVPVLGTGLIALGVFMSDLSSRVKVIESNRFTSRDASLLREKMRLELIPQWLREDIQEIKDRLRRLEERK